MYDHNLNRSFHLWYMNLNEIDIKVKINEHARYNYGIKRLLCILGNIPLHDICMNADLTIFVSLINVTN